MAAAARSLGVVEQILGYWVKFHRAASLMVASGKTQVSVGPMNSREVPAQAVQDQEDTLLLMSRQPFEEVNENLRVQSSGKDLPAHLALVGHRGHHAQVLMSCVGTYRRSRPFWGITANAHIVRE